jgi:class 3 adenylate cyclase
MYLSYDAFTFSTCQEYRNHTNFYDVPRAPKDQLFTLSFVLLFIATTRRHHFVFKHSLAFVPLALFLSNIQDASTLFQSRVVDADSPCPYGWESNYSIVGKTLVFLQALLNVAIAYTEENQSKQTFLSGQKAENTQKRSHQILATLMPPLVVNELKALPLNAPPPSHKYRHATIAQSDLCGFTKLASTRSPKEVVVFMGDLFGAFDRLTDKHGVYKVETIGDAYIAGMAEAPLTKTNIPVNVILFGLDMVRAVDDWARSMNVAVACRVGIHYGECIGGIVGFDMQRYHLFGDLLVGLEVLESTAEEGRVQVSNACKEEVERQLREDSYVKITRAETPTFIPRTGEHLKTSKGEIHSFDEVGGRTFLVQSNVELRRTFQQ